MSTFLNLQPYDDQNCLLCSKPIKKSEKCIKCTNRGWPTLKNEAKQWSRINIPFNEEIYIFTAVYPRVEDLEHPIGKVHKSCRTKFTLRLTSSEEKYGLIPDPDVLVPSETESNVLLSPGTRRRSAGVATRNHERKCFICATKRVSDDNFYNEGGLARCCEVPAKEKLELAMNEILGQETHRYHESALRLQRLVSGASHDIFAADVYYHQSCYIKFSLKKKSTKSNEEDLDYKMRVNDLMDDFFNMVKRKILHQKNAILLHDLLNEFINMSAVHDLCEPPIKHTSNLKIKLSETFPEDLSFYPSSKYVIVHSSDMNPCEYALATLKGHGLRDLDHVKAFSNMVQRKLKSFPEYPSWPYSPEEVLQLLDRGPMKELYNVIYATLGKRIKINKEGYAETSSHQLATKIWSLAADWEALLTKEYTAKQVMTGAVFHRLTGRREVTEMSHKMNNSISYNKTREQNIAWADMVTSQQTICTELVQGVPTHFTLDNNDGTEETATGRGTTHDTNMTLFQPLLKGESNLKPALIKDSVCEVPLAQRLEIPEFEIGTRRGPPLFPLHEDNDNRDCLEWCLKRDVAWALSVGLSGKEDGLKLMGSWTCFNKEVTENNFQKSLLQYLPVIQTPPEYPVCKKFLDDAIDIMNELKLGYIFAHSDEQVYARLAHILWKYPDMYRNVVLLMGGFHQLRVRQKTIYKRHACKGYRKWWVDAGIIAEGSADQAVEGRHYYRCMRAHKECFTALVQYRVEDITSAYDKMDEQLKSQLMDLLKIPKPDKLQNIINTPAFNQLYEHIFCHNDATEARMTIAYLKDISSLLAMVFAVRTGNLECHLQAEREMLKYCFAFDHINYARYMSYQQVYLRDLENKSHPAINDIKQRGFGGSMSGEAFSSIHGDLITEIFNGETKRQAGPHRKGFSGNINAVNTWVTTAHIHAKMRRELRNKIRLSTSSVHKELTRYGRKLFVSHVESLKQKLRAYNVNPFAPEPAKEIATGKELDSSLVQGLLGADKVGNDAYKLFVKERLIEGSIQYFAPIRKMNINTGLKKKKTTPKAISVIKEDRQAFGLIISKNIRLEDAFLYPLTSMPLSIATPDNELRQGAKSMFRNLIMNDANAITVHPLQRARWLVDGMAAMRSIKPKGTYADWCLSLVRSVTPATSEPITIEFINDTYKLISVKSGTRLSRGEVSRRVHLQGSEQHMVKGKEWNSFFNNIENKTDLIKLVVNTFKSEKFRQYLPTTLISNVGDETWKITSSGVEHTSTCTHEEADTRLILHACIEDTPLIIVSSDTDVFILLVHAFSKVRPTEKWYMKIDNTRYIDIEKCVDYLGDTLCTYLPQFHALTGCDTTSYFYNVGKVTVMRKCIKNPEMMELLEPLGKRRILCDDDIAMVSKFVQLMCYNGKESESIVDMKVRMYKNMKVKNSQSLPPDPESLKQHLFRVHHQVYYWLRYNNPSVVELNLEQYGWQVDRETGIVTPVWFRGPQLPQSMEHRISHDDVQIEPAAKQPRLEESITKEYDDNAGHSLMEDTLDIEKELEYIYFGDSDDSEDGDSDYDDYI